MSMEERLQTEYENFRKTRKFKFYALPVKGKQKNGAIRWERGIPGPDNELYKNSYFTVFLDFPVEYPYRPPFVSFKNYVYHPNVYANKQLCLDIVGEKWKPGLNVMSILLGIQQLFDDPPNVRSPANTTAGKLYSRNKEAYNHQVKENIVKHHQVADWKY